MSNSVVIIGASRGPGRILFENLRDKGESVIGLARNRRDVKTSDNAQFIECDAADTTQLIKAIGDNVTVVHATRPEILTALLEAEPPLERLIAIGSTRVYTRFPDDKCSRLAAMSHAIWMRDIPTTLLHPTMIYGSEGFNNIERIVKVAQRSPWIPLPAGGSALIQPVHVKDVVASIEACLIDEATINQTIVIAGKEALSYRDFVETCTKFAETNCRVISLPYFIVSCLGLLTHLIPGVPSISQDEIRRLLEDKNFDTGEMEKILGVTPVAFAEGLSLANR